MIALDYTASFKEVESASLKVHQSNPDRFPRFTVFTGGQRDVIVQLGDTENDEKKWVNYHKFPSNVWERCGNHEFIDRINQLLA